MGNLEERPSATSSLGVGRVIADEVHRSPALALIVFVPIVILLERIFPDRHTLLFLVSVVAIVPLAALLSRATEAVAAKTGDAVGGC
jgi:Ca2+:H+ antiporter